MTRSALTDRWTSWEGRALRLGAMRFLLGLEESPPAGIGTHEGRHDLRGLVWLDVSARETALAEELVTAPESRAIQRRRWIRLDLSDAQLDHCRFFDATIEDCVFDRAHCSDWRLWNSDVQDSSFVGADLWSSALGTWPEGSGNLWRGVAFDRADLRQALLCGCELDRCTFRRARLSGAQFQQVVLRDSTFVGPMRDVLFDGRDLPDRPAGTALVDVDFSGATFRDVEFRGCRFERVTLPPEITAIPDFPGVARRALQAIGDDPTIEAKIMRAELCQALKLPGAESSVGVFNRADYVASGGETLADYAQELFDAART